MSMVKIGLLCNFCVCGINVWQIFSNICIDGPSVGCMPFGGFVKYILFNCR